MPEFPEVYNVILGLKENVLNKKILSINILYPKVFENYKNELNNLKIDDIKQVGKYILFMIDSYVLISHLRMEGKYFLTKDNPLNSNHNLMYFKLEDNIYLNYLDTRRFGRFVLKTKDNYLNTLPLSKLSKNPFEIDLDTFYNRIKNSKSEIKKLLLNQEIILGIGNIYADEILFYSKINPFKKGFEINKNDCINIIENAKIIFEKSIKEKGTTVSSFSALGHAGNFQKFLKVHMQKGKPCKDCGDIIIKTELGGRGTYYCKNCQK